jgi:hypothetical protein
MSWKETCAMNEKLLFVADVQNEELSFTEACRRRGTRTARGARIEPLPVPSQQMVLPMLPGLTCNPCRRLHMPLIFGAAPGRSEAQPTD